jgi:hypothetical protein
MPYRYSISVLIIFFHCTISNAATDSFRIHTDLPYLKKSEKMMLDVFCSADSAFKGDLFVAFYKYNDAHDSILVLQKKVYKTFYKRGLNKLRVDFSKTDTNTFFEHNFYEILKRTENVAPGSYKVLLTVKKKDSIVKTEVYIREIDSILKPGSPVRKDINKSLTPKSKSFLGMKLKEHTRIGRPSSGGGSVSFVRGRTKVDKAAKKRGLKCVYCQKDGTSYTDLYFQDWFAGRYEVKDKEALSEQIKRSEHMANTNDFNSIAKNDLGSPSLISQYKSLNSTKKNKEEVKGTISLTTTTANAQEQNSGLNNNYYEVRSVTDVPVMGIPMELDAYYTSQDNGRTVKSSYVRLHYNVAKAKDELFKSLTSYNTKYSASTSKSVGSERIYMAVISKLEGQKRKLQDKGKNRKGNTPGLDHLDEQSEIEEIDKRIEKYKTLLEQQKNTKYFDSSLGYDKTKDLAKAGDLSYKDMAKKGRNMLPDGKEKGFLSGITTIDVGMFPKSESRYTMSGQMIKGGDFGYDLGFCETGITAGKTEFIGRNGSLDKYTCYSTKASFKSFKSQKVSIIYYGYSADRSLYSSDAFFKKVNISAPSFFEPVQVIATTYTGNVSKYVTVEGEVATSMKNTYKAVAPEIQLPEKMAYYFCANGNIPGTPLSLGVAYEKMGRSFENNTLPISLLGTEHYKGTARTELFRSFLTVGVEFNRLIQNSFARSSSNTKWGFDARTNFRKYPNLEISYKPFTTFQSHTDTLGIPQRPMFGSVSTGKVTYQLKRKSQAWRFSLLYTESKTILDTAKYGSSTAQVLCTYSDKRLMYSAGVGYMQLTGTQSSIQSTPAKTKYINLNTSYNLSKKMTVSCGQDFGFAPFGLCRIGVSGAATYRMQKPPVSIRLSTRYNTYLRSETESWREVYGCTLDIGYRFKAKMK